MKYYDVNPIINLAEKKNCPTVVIVGGKGNGKTYGIILRYLKEFIKTGRILRYVRRFRESITPKAILSLLLPHKQNITNLTGGKYNDYQYFRNRFYLTRTENGERVAKMNQPFIVCSALNSVEGFTGADEGECSAIFFDEMLSREKELDDEFTSLMIFHDNAVRNRTSHYTPLILVGNTVSKNSTLAKDFGINFYNIKQGEITAIYNSKKEITSIVEHCPIVEVMEQAGDTFYKRYENDKIKMIYTGDWSVGNYPRIRKNIIDNSDVMFTFLLVTDGDNLKLEIRKYKNFLFGYVSYFNKNDKADLTVTTKITPLHNNIINYFASKIRIFRTLGYMLVRNQIFFQYGECGELFRDFLSNLNGAEQFRKIYK